MDWIEYRIVHLTVWMAYVTTSTDIANVLMEKRDHLSAIKVRYSYRQLKKYIYIKDKKTLHLIFL